MFVSSFFKFFCLFCCVGDVFIRFSFIRMWFDVLPVSVGVFGQPGARRPSSKRADKPLFFACFVVALRAPFGNYSLISCVCVCVSNMFHSFCWSTVWKPFGVSVDLLQPWEWWLPVNQTIIFTFLCVPPEWQELVSNVSFLVLFGFRDGQKEISNKRSTKRSRNI